mmetsp:Transcript_25140/g.52983  ORF Transcript_25140/g.52983 Transcript_25140/m.52983 type:complete len:207 (+) Transcript_25140:1040-1660(+)
MRWNPSLSICSSVKLTSSKSMFWLLRSLETSRHPRPSSTQFHDMKILFGVTPGSLLKSVRSCSIPRCPIRFRPIFSIGQLRLFNAEKRLSMSDSDAPLARFKSNDFNFSFFSKNSPIRGIHSDISLRLAYFISKASMERLALMVSKNLMKKWSFFSSLLGLPEKLNCSDFNFVKSGLAMASPTSRKNASSDSEKVSDLLKQNVILT